MVSVEQYSFVVVCTACLSWQGATLDPRSSGGALALPADGQPVALCRHLRVQLPRALPLVAAAPPRLWSLGCSSGVEFASAVPLLPSRGAVSFAFNIHPTGVSPSLGPGGELQP